MNCPEDTQTVRTMLPVIIVSGMRTHQDLSNI